MATQAQPAGADFRARMSADSTDLAIVGDDQASSLRRTRSDLHEVTFAAQRTLVGA